MILTGGNRGSTNRLGMPYDSSEVAFPGSAPNRAGALGATLRGTKGGLISEPSHFNHTGGLQEMTTSTLNETSNRNELHSMLRREIKRVTRDVKVGRETIIQMTSDIKSLKRKIKDEKMTV